MSKATSPQGFFLLVITLLIVRAGPVQGQPFWPQFRGPTGQGISETARPPVHLSTNALWSADLPPGHSSPAVWGSKIFLTACQSNKLDCRAYDRLTGKLLWVKPVPAEKLERTHAFNNPAAPTAAADAERVIFYLGSYGLQAYTHAGELVWEKKLPMQVSRGNYGSSTSPVLCRDLVLLAQDTDEEGSKLLALKRADGKPAWEASRVTFKAGWSTPLVWTKGDYAEIVLLGFKRLMAYDPADGKELWSVPGFTIETAASPACDADHVFACSAGIGGRSSLHFDSSLWGQLLKFDSNHDNKIQFDEVPKEFRFVQRPELPEGHPGRLLPFPPHALMAEVDEDKDKAITEQEWNKFVDSFEQMDVPVVMGLRAGKSSEERVIWKYSRGIPEVPSPLAYEGKLYLVRDGGLLQCMDPATGAVLYQERLGAPGGYAASPVAAQGRIYLASQAGVITVINARSKQLEVLSQNSLNEKITATPALVEDRMYIRTERHLLAF